jgi:PhnB protein
MTMATKPIPDGYTTVSVYLGVDDAGEAIEFYKRAFGATERGIMHMPDGKVGHAELQLGDTVLMLSDPFPQSSLKPPKQLGGTSVALFMYVEDVDSFVDKAVEGGATLATPVEDMFWGDRYGKLSDPFGHEWQVATHKEDLTPEEINERGKKAMAGVES